MCEWGTAKPWLWAKGIGNLWRTTGDITDHFEGKGKWPDGNCCWVGMIDIVEMQNGIEAYAGPGHWNDPDMLEIGNGGMTNPEYQTHFSFWAMLAAPLMSGNDVRSMTPEIKEILTNKEVIAIDQDKLGRQGRRVSKNGDLEIWARPLSDGGRAVILFNRSTTESEISVTWEQIAYPNHLSAKVRDLWAHKDLGAFTGGYSTKVAPHSVAMLKVLP
jgi:alpha-galactosidase